MLVNMRNSVNHFPASVVAASLFSYDSTRSTNRQWKAAQRARDTGTHDMPADPQLEKLKFDVNGLIPIIVQDHANGEVLMMAFMNREAIDKTIVTGKVHTYSRSRGRLALKGETSGHFQLVKTVLTDCDRDVVLFKVEQIVAACHEGYRSCFFREYERGADDWKVAATKAFDPHHVYPQQKK